MSFPHRWFSEIPEIFRNKRPIACGQDVCSGPTPGSSMRHRNEADTDFVTD